MRSYSPILNPACCIYCRQKFLVKGKQRWHGCELSLKAKRKEWNDRRDTRLKNPEYKALHRKKAFSRDGWKKCISCDATTPNYFGRCNACLGRLSGLYDLDLIMHYEVGDTRRHRSHSSVQE